MRGTLTEIVIAIGEEFEAITWLRLTERTHGIVVECIPAAVAQSVVHWLHRDDNPVRPVGVLFKAASLPHLGLGHEISRRSYKRGLGGAWWEEEGDVPAQSVQPKRAKVDRFDDTHEEFAVRRRGVNDP